MYHISPEMPETKWSFPDVLLTSNGSNVNAGNGVGAVVKAEIISDLVKGDKVIAFKMKRRKVSAKARSPYTVYTYQDQFNQLN